MSRGHITVLRLHWLLYRMFSILKMTIFLKPVSVFMEVAVTVTMVLVGL